jgi:hypothetical protein
MKPSRRYTRDDTLEDIEFEISMLEELDSVESWSNAGKGLIKGVTRFVVRANDHFAGGLLPIQGVDIEIQDSINRGKFNGVLGRLVRKFMRNGPMEPEWEIAMLWGFPFVNAAIPQVMNFFDGNKGGTVAPAIEPPKQAVLPRQQPQTYHTTDDDDRPAAAMAKPGNVPPPTNDDAAQKARAAEAKLRAEQQRVDEQKKALAEAKLRAEQQLADESRRQEQQLAEERKRQEQQLSEDRKRLEQKLAEERRRHEQTLA